MESCVGCAGAALGARLAIVRLPGPTLRRGEVEQLLAATSFYCTVASPDFLTAGDEVREGTAGTMGKVRKWKDASTERCAARRPTSAARVAPAAGR